MLNRNRLVLISVVAFALLSAAIYLVARRAPGIAAVPPMANQPQPQFANSNPKQIPADPEALPEKIEWPEKPIFPLPQFVLTKDLPKERENSFTPFEAIDWDAKRSVVKLAPAAVPTLKPTSRLGDPKRVGPSVSSSLTVCKDGSRAAFVGNAISQANATYSTHLVLWDVKAGQPTRQLQLPNVHVNAAFPVALSPDGETVLLSTPHDSAFDSGPLRAWSTLTGLPLYERTPTSLWALSADGNTLATLDIHEGDFDRGFSDGPEVPWRSTLTFWNREDLRPRTSYMYTSLVPRSLALAPDGSTAIVDYNGEAIALDAATGKVRWRQKVLESPSSHDSALYVFSPDGTSVAIVNGRSGLKSSDIYLLDVATGNKRLLLSRKGDGFDKVTSFETLGMSFTPDGKTLYAAFGDAIVPIDVATGNLPPPRPATGDDLFRGEFHRRGIHPGGTSQHLQTFAFSADGSTLLLSGLFHKDACDLMQIDPKTRRVVFPPPPIHVKAPKPTVDAFPESSDMRHEFPVRRELYPTQHKLSKGRSLEWSGSWSEPILLHTTAGKKPIVERLHGYMVTPDSETLLTRGQYDKKPVNERHVAFHDIASGREWGAIAAPAGYRGGGWREMALSADGRMLALINSGDDSIWLWEIATVQPRLRLAPAGNQIIYAFTFATDGKSLLANDYHGQTGLVWDFAYAFPGTPKAGELESLWADLAGDDASRAYGALHRLARVPDLTIPYLAAKAARERVPRSLTERPFSADVVRARRIVETLEVIGSRNALAALEKLAASQLPQFDAAASAAASRVRNAQ